MSYLGQTAVHGCDLFTYFFQDSKYDILRSVAPLMTENKFFNEFVSMKLVEKETNFTWL